MTRRGRARLLGCCSMGRAGEDWGAGCSGWGQCGLLLVGPGGDVVARLELGAVDLGDEALDGHKQLIAVLGLGGGGGQVQCA